MAAELQLRTPQMTSLPSLFTARPEARMRLRDFLSSHIRNPNTRRAYREAIRQFSAYCAFHGVAELAQVEPIHVAAFVEAQLKVNSKPTVKVRLAALWMLFDCMVVGQIIPTNRPMPSVAQNTRSGVARRPSFRLTSAHSPRSIDVASLPDLRDRAPIGLTVYAFARVGAATAMKVEDFFVQGGADGCGSTRRVAKSTRCRRITT